MRCRQALTKATQGNHDVNSLKAYAHLKNSEVTRSFMLRYVRANGSFAFGSFSQRFLDLHNRVHSGTIQYLHNSAGPVNVNSIHYVLLAQAKMYPLVAGREETHTCC